MWSIMSSALERAKGKRNDFSKSVYMHIYLKNHPLLLRNLKSYSEYDHFSLKSECVLKLIQIARDKSKLNC